MGTVTDPAGSAVPGAKVTAENTATNEMREASVDIRPCYSSDQRWVYFTSKRTGTFQIWKIPAPWEAPPCR